jgi:hypothetical protein
LLRMAVPYLLLALVVLAYLVYRRRKYGRVIYRVDRVLFSRSNVDVFVSLAVFAVVIALFIRYDLRLANGAAPWSPDVLRESNILFYLALFAVFALRQTEKPAIREFGISSPRGNWLYERIASYRWSGATVLLKIPQGKRTRTENWQIPPQSKKELTGMLKKSLRDANRK